MNKQPLYKLPYLLIGLFIFGYVFIRVFTIPITTDEAWTLYSYIRAPFWEVVTIKYPSTNNHIFNTLLAKLTTLFSEKEFFLRLPNLLSLPLYIYGSYKIAQLSFTNKLLALAMFIAMMCNFTLLDFFGLCRGYGLSIGLLTLSIAYLVKFVKQDNHYSNKDLHILLFSATAAFYANIAVLHVMAAIMLITMIVLYKSRKQQPVLKRLQLPLVYGVIITIVGGLKLLKQYNLGEIFYGGANNFVDDTIASMMMDFTGHGYFHSNSTWTMNIAVAIVALSIIVHLAFIKQVKKQPWVFVPVAVLLFNIVLFNFQFYVLDVLLPINRIALFFYPLMILSVFSMLHLLRPYLRTVSIALGLLITGFCVSRFADNMNLYKMDLWWFDMYSEQVVNDILKDNKDSNAPSIYAYWPSDNSVNYYVNIYHGGELIESPCCTRFEQLDSVLKYDYLYLQKEHDVSAYPELQAIKTYHAGDAFVLYKNTGR